MTSQQQDKTILRGRRKQTYTTISNSALQDEKLSLEAVGLLACILSLPTHWNFNRAHARQRFKVGREKLDRIIKELKEFGYVRQTQERDEAGRMAQSVYVFTEDAFDFDEDEPLTPNPYHGDDPLPAEPRHGDPFHDETAPIKRKETLENKKIESAPTGADRNISPEEAPPAAAPCPPPASAPAAAIDWRNRLIQYRKRAIWAKNWGPPMHAPGCLVPPDLVREYDATQGKAFVEEEQKPAWQGRKKRDWQHASSAIN